MRGGLATVVRCLVGHIDHLGPLRAALYVVADLDPSWLSALFHRDRQGQRAIGVVGADVLGVDVVAEDELPGEAVLRQSPVKAVAG